MKANLDAFDSDDPAIREIAAIDCDSPATLDDGSSRSSIFAKDERSALLAGTMYGNTTAREVTG